MDIEQLQSVLAIVKEKTFLDAAESLHRSQSSVSKSIQKLEQELDITIFERTTRRVNLTPAGEDVVAYAEKILENYEGLLHAMEYHRTANLRELRIGSIYFGKNNLLLPLVAEFMKLHPSMNVTSMSPLLHPFYASWRPMSWMLYSYPACIFGMGNIRIFRMTPASSPALSLSILTT